LYGHFEGVFRNGGKAAGHITIVRLARGWFWLIPLAGGRTSVGLVLPAAAVRGGAAASREEVFWEAVRSSTEMRGRMSGARALTPLHASADYSWRRSIFAGGRVVMAGDASGFVDPIFSSGVLLALKSAVLAAELVLGADAEGRALEEAECRAYTGRLGRWMGQYARMIEAFYDAPGFEVFMSSSPRFKIRRAIGRLVGGETEPDFGDRVRLGVFQVLCRLQGLLAVVPRIPYLRGESAR